MLSQIETSHFLPRYSEGKGFDSLQGGPRTSELDSDSGDFIRPESSILVTHGFDAKVKAILALLSAESVVHSEEIKIIPASLPAFCREDTPAICGRRLKRATYIILAHKNVFASPPCN